jgi:hypothetical protein
VRKLEGVLNSLSDRQKELIYLRFYQSLSFEQIAEVMNFEQAIGFTTSCKNRWGACASIIS